MIAKVRIAPVDRWCTWANPDRIPEAATLVGMEIEIETSSMFRDYFLHPESRLWLLTEASKRRIFESLPGRATPDSRWLICEHMLEMD